MTSDFKVLKPSDFKLWSDYVEALRNASDLVDEPPELPKKSYNSFKQSDFLRYLHDTKRTKFVAYSLSGVRILPYIHRWSIPYRNMILAKLYRLSDWYDTHVSNVTMLTFTTYQKNITYPDQLMLLKKSFNKIRQTISKFEGNSQYFWILEHHKSGYAHMHCMYFRFFSQVEQQTIRSLWSDKYGAGSAAHGVNFSGQIKQQTSIGSLKAYLMKYLSKTFYDESPGQLLFNFNVWAMQQSDDYPGIRLLGSSRAVSAIMKFPGEVLDKNKSEFIETHVVFPESNCKLNSNNQHMSPFTRNYLVGSINKKINDLNFY